MTTTSREPMMDAAPSKLKDVRAHELVVRFAFGAAISVIAGLVSMAFGAKAGGMFLAFPAILPATLTLIEKKESTTASVHAVHGAAVGGVGLVAFAVVVAAGAGRLPAAALLGLALASWVLVSMGSYVAWEGMRRAAMRSRRRRPHATGRSADVATTAPGLRAPRL